MTMFQRATKKAAKLRLALAGPAGSGKTMTGLRVAAAIAEAVGGKPAVIDTENGSASKYADLFDFDAATLDASTGFSPEAYIELIQGAEAAGYPVILIDSLSHEWAGPRGVLELVDQAAARMNGNKFQAWGQVTPRHDKLVRAIVESKAHVICTMRAKMDHVQEKNERGKTEVRLVGMKPIQRDELEYEFDVYGLLDQDNRLVIKKTRCSALSGAIIDKPGEDVAQALLTWLAGTPLTPDERGQLEESYDILAGEAIDLGHPHAEKLKATKPSDLNDDVLRASETKLAAWVTALRKKKPAAPTEESADAPEEATT